MAVDGEGDVYVVDWMNERVVIFNAEGNTMATLRGEARGLSKWAEMSINSNPDMGLARRRVKNPEVQNYFRMPVACIFDQPTNRLIVCDTHRGRLQIYEKGHRIQRPPIQPVASACTHQRFNPEPRYWAPDFSLDQMLCREIEVT